MSKPRYRAIQDPQFEHFYRIERKFLWWWIVVDAAYNENGSRLPIRDYLKRLENRVIITSETP